MAVEGLGVNEKEIQGWKGAEGRVRKSEAGWEPEASPTRRERKRSLQRRQMRGYGGPGAVGRRGQGTLRCLREVTGKMDGVGVAARHVTTLYFW